MLYFKDVPVVIEPGVAALEVSIMSVSKGKERMFFVPFERVAPNSTNAEKLPLIISSNFPHVFTMRKDLDSSPFLLVYDMVGKLSMVYTREAKSGVWLRNEAAPEQVGDTVTQFSVRFSFDSVSNRNSFVETIDEIMAARHSGKRLMRSKIEYMLDLLMTADEGPVMLPVAVAKKTTV